MAAAAASGMIKPAVISTSVFRRMQTWKAQHPDAQERYVAYHEPTAQYPCHVIRLRRLRHGRTLPSHYHICDMPADLFQPTIVVGGVITSLGWA